MNGVELRPAESLLVSRARDYLAGGPSDVVPLIEHICQIPGAPRAVAEHMAATLLAGQPDIATTRDGRWCLARDVEAADAATGAGAVTTALESSVGAAGAATAGFADAPRPLLVDGDGATRPLVATPAELLSELSYVVVDVETTGGRPQGGDRITEVAAVVVRNGEVCDVFETLVNPQRPIPPMITALTNITWDMVRDAPVFRDIAPRLGEVLRGNVFVAHNASFDWRFIEAEFARATGEQLAGRRLCTVRLARRVLPQLRRRSLDSVAHHYGVDIAARHRAAGDAVATAHILVRLLRDAAGHGCSTWTELDAFLSARAPSRRRSRRSGMPRFGHGEDGR